MVESLAARFRKATPPVPPDQEEHDRHLVRLLATRFGGLDFWQLSKDWKLVVYEQVAHEILMLFDLDRPIDQREPPNERNEINERKDTADG